MIFTHINPDLDAIFTTVAYCLTNNIPITDEFIQLVPANQQDFPNDSILIDLEKNKHSLERCAFMDYEEMVPKVVAMEVNIQDCYHADLGSLQLMLMALKKSGKKEIELFQWFEPIVRGLMRLKSGWDQASESYDKIPIIDIGKYKFMKIENNYLNYHNLTEYGIAHNIAGKVYLDGYNMGIVRFGFGVFDPRDRTWNPNLYKLPPIKEPNSDRKWFSHPQGFLLSYGTYKSPATTFCRAFDNLDGFIAWLDKKFKDYNL